MARTSRSRSSSKNKSDAGALLDLFKENSAIWQRNDPPAERFVDRMEGRPSKPSTLGRTGARINIASILHEARLRALAKEDSKKIQAVDTTEPS